MSSNSSRSYPVYKLVKALTTFVTLVSAILVFTSQSFAHHSVSGQFDLTTKMELRGVVTRVSWVNPHIYIQLEVTDENGKVETWQLGTVPVSMARRAGLSSKRLLGNGEPIRVEAYPARDGTSHLGYLNVIEFSDGTTVTVNPDRI